MENDRCEIEDVGDNHKGETGETCLMGSVVRLRANDKHTQWSG